MWSTEVAWKPSSTNSRSAAARISSRVRCCCSARVSRIPPEFVYQRYLRCKSLSPCFRLPDEDVHGPRVAQEVREARVVAHPQAEDVAAVRPAGGAKTPP